MRAVAYDSSSPPVESASVTSSYIFLNDVIHQPANIPTASDPKFSGYPSGYLRETYDVGRNYTAVHDYEMDPTVVNDPSYSAEIIPSLKAIPTLSLTADVNDMFGPTGFYDGDSADPNSTHACSIELLYPADPTKNIQIKLRGRTTQP